MLPAGDDAPACRRPADRIPRRRTGSEGRIAVERKGRPRESRRGDRSVRGAAKGEAGKLRYSAASVPPALLDRSKSRIDEPERLAFSLRKGEGVREEGSRGCPRETGGGFLRGRAPG